jgi:phosphatidylglycerophosphate synthase
MKTHNNKPYSVGRKIPPEYENPIDNILLDLCDDSVKLCTYYNITPNIITVFRIILGVFTIYYFNFSCDIFFPMIGTALFYWLDCLDGHLARKTNQVTIIGDYLDHYADITFYLALLSSMFIKEYSNKTIIIIVIIFVTYMSFIHLGLQQKNYKIIKNKIRHENKTLKEKRMIILDEIDDELLDSLNHIHNLEADNISWTKYFGTGTVYTLLAVSYTHLRAHETG